MGKQIIFILVVMLLLAACEQPVPRSNSAEGFYDVSAYLKKQKEYLQKQQPVLTKTVQTAGQPAETIKVTQTDWENELAIFEEADLKKPSLRDYYIRKEQVLSNGGISIKYYKMEDAEAPIEYLYLQLTPDRTLQHLETAFLEKNPLFYSRRKASLSVDSVTGRILSYNIEGIQKMILGDSLRYTIKANL
jgi:hypothetical protein